MDGFKETFSDLYTSSGDDDQLIGSGSGYALGSQTMTKNDSSSFCGSPDDFADGGNATKTCSSGSGVGSSSKIVGRPKRCGEIF